MTVVSKRDPPSGASSIRARSPAVSAADADSGPSPTGGPPAANTTARATAVIAAFLACREEEHGRAPPIDVVHAPGLDIASDAVSELKDEIRLRGHLLRLTPFEVLVRAHLPGPVRAGIGDVESHAAVLLAHHHLPGKPHPLLGPKHVARV